MPASGPSGDDLVNVSREHRLRAQPLYLMRTVATARGMGPIMEIMEAHLAYWGQLEQEHVLFAAGPIMPADLSDPWSGEGLVVFRASSPGAARQIAEADPMHQSGARTYELHPWLLNHLVTD